MALPEKNCPFCKGTGYRMSRLFHQQLQVDIAYEINAKVGDNPEWTEILDLASKIIEMVRDHDLDT